MQMFKSYTVIEFAISFLNTPFPYLKQLFLSFNFYILINIFITFN
jgi:hypothetical protein